MAHPQRRATDIVVDLDQRTPEKSVRSDSHARRVDGLPVHTDSRPLRIDVKKEFLANIKETRARIGLSVDAMAEICGTAASAMSDALNGKEGRNFAGHWLTALSLACPEFEHTYNQVVDEKRGNTPEAKRARAARSLGDLVEQFALRIKDIG